MLAIYFVTGVAAFVVMIIYAQRSGVHPSITQPGHHKKYLLAMLLTVALWPIVLMLAALTTPRTQQPPLFDVDKSDLVKPLTQAQLSDIFIRNQRHRHRASSFDRNNLSNTINSNVWSFKKHIHFNKMNTMIFEGYAILNEQDDIVEYVISERYPEVLTPAV